MQYIIGLTGVIGSGKSKVADIFASLGVTVIDTDLIAKKITSPEGPAIKIIKHQFGAEFITPDGALDRVKMRDTIFADTVMRYKLEHILHPLIFNSVMREIELCTDSYLIVVVPLLFRSLKYLKMIQRSIVVSSNSELIYQRLALRSQLTRMQIDRILCSQTMARLQIKLGDDIITNDDGISQLQIQVEQLNNKYQIMFK